MALDLSIPCSLISCETFKSTAFGSDKFIKTINSILEVFTKGKWQERNGNVIICVIIICFIIYIISNEIKHVFLPSSGVKSSQCLIY